MSKIQKVTKLVAHKFLQKHAGVLVWTLGMTVLLALSSCLSKNPNTHPTLTSDQNPNVLFIIVDDLKPMLSAYGESQILTPNIDSLAAKSAVFTNAHCQQAICSPSRVSFLTGMRPDFTQVWDLKTLIHDKVPDLLTLPKHFANSGYETVGLGKIFHNKEDNDPEAWTLPYVKPANLKFSIDHPTPVFHRKYQNPISRQAYKKYSWKKIFGLKKAMAGADALPSVENEDVPDDAYMDGAITLKAIRLMKRLRKKPKSFFIAVGFRKPHLPFVAPKKYWDLYDRTKLNLASFQKRAEGSPNFAYHSNGELRAYSDIPESINEQGLVKEAKQRELIHGYYACVSYIDAQIGLLMEHLKESGLEENTMVILMGDHGWHLGDHGIWNKHTNFEQATRTPLIIHSPEMESSLSNSSPVELLDVFPTVCDLTRLEKPEHLQGTSLMPILKHESDSVKSYALSQYPKKKYMGYAVRTHRYRYIEWHKKNISTSGVYDENSIAAIELYDYEIDPIETKNLADEEGYAQVRQNLKSMLKGSFSPKKLQKIE